MKTIAVIGINSFAGSSYAAKLMENGFNVIGFARQSSKPDCFLGYKEIKNTSQLSQIYLADIKYDYEKIANIVVESKTKIVINFAAKSMVAESWDSPFNWYETNLVAISHLVKALQKKKNGSLEKFIQFSTPEVYGSTKNPILENWNFSPSTPYAISRAASDFHLRAEYFSNNFPVIFTRTANIYGRHQDLYRLIPKVLIKLKKNEKILLHGGGHSRRSFIHMNDVSEALLKISDSGSIGDTYHISTNKFLTIREILYQVAASVGKKIEGLIEVVEDRKGKDEAYLLDSSFIREKLNWKDKIDLKDGIMDTHEWIEEKWSILEKIPTEYILSN